MKKSRYTEEQIIGILKQHEAGVRTMDLCREHGNQRGDVLRLEAEVRRHGRERGAALKAMEEGNRRLKLLVAELSLHGEALKAVMRKTVGVRQSKTGDVAFAFSEFYLNARPASCWAWSRSSYR
jgi:putative transposase